MDKRNQEHYYDPTAAEAVEKIADAETKHDTGIDEKAGIIIKGIKLLLKASGFKLINRIEIVHKETGKVYR